MKEQIISYLQDHGEVKTWELVNALGKERTTIYRWLKRLEESGDIIQIKKWTYQLKPNLEQYFDTPTWERKKVSYNPDFLRNYIPNTTHFFSAKNLGKLQQAVSNLSLATDFYTTNKRLIEKSLIDLSFASSYLEGNTYSQLDTEVLIKYNEISKEKTAEETQMILNHKRAIEYMIHYKKELLFSKQSFFEIHELLGDKLLLNGDLWVIRSNIVEIGGSTYTPLDNQFQLEEEFILFLDKLQQIINPFEQSLFIMVFIPYFQLFLDINKRTSRIMGNLPLVQHNLPVLSMIQMTKKDYIVAILAIYELNNTELLEQLWTENYLLNLQTYKNYFS